MNVSQCCCDGCKQRNVCREIFVLREILKDEALHLSDPQLSSRIEVVLKELDDAKFRYPYANCFCSLAKKDDLEGTLLATMHDLLSDVRKQNHVSLPL